MNNHRQVVSEPVSSCPVCGGAHLVSLEDPSDFAAFTTSGQEFVFHIGVAGCNDCGFIFLNPRASLEEMGRYYSLQSRKPRDFASLDEPFAALLDHQTSFIQSQWKPSGPQRLLDVGCAEGFFLRRLAAECRDGVTLEGVEPGAVYANAARSLLPDAIVHEQTLENCNLPSRAYDIVTLRHVLEHLLDPAAALLMLNPLLKSDGLLHIEIPDVTEMSPTISPFRHYEHINYFTPQTIRFVLERSGYRIVRLEAAQDNPKGSGFSYPIIRILAMRATDPVNKPTPASPNDVKSIYCGYAQRQTEFFKGRIDAVDRRVRELVATGKRVGIFGAGPHTMDLLNTLKMAPETFSVAFDNNPNKTGKRIRGIIIRVPDAAEMSKLDAVLISSAEFEGAMTEQVRSFDLPSLEILRLYSDD